MSLKDAFDFIRKVETDKRLAEMMKALGTLDTLDSVVDLGAKEKLIFSKDELRLAFARDWAMRAFHYTPN
jgi:hypothetical protein